MSKHLVTCSKSPVEKKPALQDFPRGTAIWRWASLLHWQSNTLPAPFNTHTHISLNRTEVPVPSHTQRCCTDTVPFTLMITDYYSFLFSGHYLTSCPISKEQGHSGNQWALLWLWSCREHNVQGDEKRNLRPFFFFVFFFFFFPETLSASSPSETQVMWD